MSDEPRELQEKVTELCALRRLRLVYPAAVVAWATQLWEESDVPAGVAALADLVEAREYDVDVQLDALAEEIGLEPLTEELTGLVAAKWIARQLSGGTLSPIEAARKLSRIVEMAPSTEPRLGVFVGLASEWDDAGAWSYAPAGQWGYDPAHRASFDDDIRSEALRLEGEAL